MLHARYGNVPRGFSYTRLFVLVAPDILTSYQILVTKNDFYDANKLSCAKLNADAVSNRSICCRTPAAAISISSQLLLPVSGKMKQLEVRSQKHGWRKEEQTEMACYIPGGVWHLRNPANRSRLKPCPASRICSTTLAVLVGLEATNCVSETESVKKVVPVVGGVVELGRRDMG
ncbi:uncharacterized protein LY79DRAFT_582078 [Colletotrichum navitas]|uniref:Uncharacterized protein n=1 Tax=Colletotrichum navitas TaxID=681940 RepID=A0AAD8V2Y6_9PEZI|nr:uncharacterized protein LY79DRAFT_582078 [Colletotrichum navitas]KAK1580178.1 hypothetical protein LY79DRAFT_582078 [Colletotrichum navitas]